jgi:hypothetical protein
MLCFLQFEHRNAIVKEEVRALTDGKTEANRKGRRTKFGESGGAAGRNYAEFLSRAAARPEG